LGAKHLGAILVGTVQAKLEQRRCRLRTRAELREIVERECTRLVDVRLRGLGEPEGPTVGHCVAAHD
jgi:hypothetical protein